MRRRSRRRSPSWAGLLIDTPSIMTSPVVGGISPTTILATVDLPEPDSPTSAKVSRRAIEKETSAAATSSRCGSRSITRLSHGFETSKMRPRSLTSTSGLAGAAVSVGAVASSTLMRRLGGDREGMVEPAGDLRARFALQLGAEGRAGHEGARAARMERAAGRDRGQARHRAGDLHQPVVLGGRARGSSPSGPLV